jgi:frataxin-like iron-binding protein CyaY
MAAERTAWHFDWTEQGWKAAKDGSELGATLREVLAKKLGRPVALSV